MAQAHAVPAGWSALAGQRPAAGRSFRRSQRRWCRVWGSRCLPRSTLCHKVDSTLWHKVKVPRQELYAVKQVVRSRQGHQTAERRAGRRGSLSSGAGRPGFGRVNGSPAWKAERQTAVVEFIATQLAAIPGVVAVTLGGSRATDTAVEGSDWDFGLYYQGRLDPADVEALGWPGRVFAPGEWGRIVNGGAWLTIDGTKVDLIYRDIDEVLRWTEAAEAGHFEIHREVGYVAGMATYVLTGELSLGRVLTGVLPRPEFPEKLRATAPAAWFRIAAG